MPFIENSASKVEGRIKKEWTLKKYGTTRTVLAISSVYYLTLLLVRKEYTYFSLYLLKLFVSVSKVRIPPGIFLIKRLPKGQLTHIQHGVYYLVCNSGCPKNMNQKGVKVWYKVLGYIRMSQR